MEESSINSLLKLCRERSRMTQKELAFELKLDRTTVTKIETGVIKPSYTLVKEWAKATNSVEVVGLDFSGNDGWRKLKQLEDRFTKIRELVAFVRIRRVKG